MVPRSRRVSRQERQPDFDRRRQFVQGFLAFVFLILGGGALYRHVLESDFLGREGRLRYLRAVEIPAYRGMITDRHGEPLAVSTPVDSVWVNPRKLSLDMATLRPLAHALEMDAKQLLSMLEKRSGRGFVYVQRRVNPDISKQVADLNLEAVGMQREYRRYYPAGEVTAHLIGFTNIEDIGQEGLELGYDEWLRGVPGRKLVLQDGREHVVKDVESVQEPKPGKDLNLSIDRRIQFLAYRELKAAVQENKARGGSVVVLDAQTGEILAMVNQPSYNPNGHRDTGGGRTRNRAMTDLFEPGSTAKTFTVAAALEYKRIRPDSIIHTAPGTLFIGSNRVVDHHPLGSIDVATVLSKSSNVGATKIALEMSPVEMWQVFSRIGFGRSTESGYPGEASGVLPAHKEWSRFEQATISFGYGFSLTALQLAQAYSVIANDGIKKPLTLLRRTEPPEGERVLSAQTARAVRAMEEGVVSRQGTAQSAAVVGYRVSGKTGTARKSVAGGYSHKKYQALFAGMVPATAPRLVAVVMIDEPGAGEYYGGKVAAPVFSKIMTDALRLLNVPPDQPEAIQLRVASAGSNP